MFPKFPSKHNDPSFVQPQDFLQSFGKIDKLPRPQVLMVYHQWLLRQLAQTLGLEISSGGFVAGDYWVTCSPGIGAPATIVFLEELWARGLRQVITVGSAGALSGGYPVASAYVVAESVRDEGTSYHYVPASERIGADKALLAQLEQKLNLPIVATWTTDAPYRETAAEIKHWAEQGVAAVEMEASAVFAWARYRQVSAAAVVVISDLLTGDRWQPHFQNQKLKESLLTQLSHIVS